jgi:hypothetical protein
MPRFVVRYKTTSDQAEENQLLVERVYAELAETGPEGLRYATFRLADGVTFVHVADVESDDHNPLSEVVAFEQFQQDIAGRCEEPPDAQEATVVGSYRVFG